MALRRVLGSSSKYIQNYGRLIGSHGRSVSTPTNTKKQEFDYQMDLGGLGPAHFATQEFNRIKNAQLQISRVLKATCWHIRKELWRSQGYYYQRYYELVLEAVDADETTFWMNDASNSRGPDLFVYLCSVFAVSRLLYMSTVTEANEVKMCERGHRQGRSVLLPAAAAAPQRAFPMSADADLLLQTGGDVPLP